jgi:maltose alpha-D-glucosyltransferase / alpha-amylase
LGPEFHPEPIGPSDLIEWADSARARLGRLLATDETLNRERSEIEARISDFTSLHEDLGFKSRIHGDYHLAQVLLGNRGWLIIDFEGEPSRSLNERRARQTALKDAAGMLRSFGYASAVALFERVEKDSDEWNRLKPWADAWEELARDRFLAAYLSKSHEGRFLPSDREILGTMIAFFELDKALYELEYERAHRPHWAWIPRAGIERTMQRA